MAVAVDCILYVREGTSTLHRAIEATLGMIGRSNGKDLTSYLEAYRSEMMMRDICEDRRLSGFPWVVTPSIHTEVFDVQARCQNWLDFEAHILERYNFDESLWLFKR